MSAHLDTYLRVWLPRHPRLVWKQRSGGWNTTFALARHGGRQTNDNWPHWHALSCTWHHRTRLYVQCIINLLMLDTASKAHWLTWCETCLNCHAIHASTTNFSWGLCFESIMWLMTPHVKLLTDFQTLKAVQPLCSHHMLCLFLRSLAAHFSRRKVQWFVLRVCNKTVLTCSLPVDHACNSIAGHFWCQSGAACETFLSHLCR